MRRLNRFQQRRANDPNSVQNLRQRNRRDRIINRATNQNNQKRIISYRRRNIRRNRGRPLPRLRNMNLGRSRFRTNINNRNNNKLNNIDEKINDLANDMDKLALKNNPVVNKFKTKKEMRNDILISAMNMAKYSNKLGFFKTNLRVVKTDFYNKYNTQVKSTDNRVCYFWMPYTFPNLPHVQLKKNELTGQPTVMASLLKYVSDTDAYIYPMNITQLSGSCRLIAATLHIMNISPLIQKQGVYTIYQLHDNAITPIAARTDFGLDDDAITLGNLKHFKEVANGPLSTVTNKMTFSALDDGYIDEYNTHEGSNIFQATTEYMNCNFENPDQLPVAMPNSLHYPYNASNPVGSNITYLIEIPATATNQDYMFETWSVWEVAPSVNSGLGNLASLDNQLFSEHTFNLACNSFPIHK